MWRWFFEIWKLCQCKKWIRCRAHKTGIVVFFFSAAIVLVILGFCFRFCMVFLYIPVKNVSSVFRLCTRPKSVLFKTVDVQGYFSKTVFFEISGVNFKIKEKSGWINFGRIRPGKKGEIKCSKACKQWNLWGNISLKRGVIQLLERIHWIQHGHFGSI